MEEVGEDGVPFPVCLVAVDIDATWLQSLTENAPWWRSDARLLRFGAHGHQGRSAPNAQKHTPDAALMSRSRSPDRIFGQALRGDK